MFFPSERSLTKLTPMWRFASVDAHMIRQMLLTSKWLGAEVASMWRFACVLTHVIGQMFLPREGFGAILALVRWLTRVLPDVVHQVILPRKCFRTVWTAEGRLPCTYFTSEFAYLRKICFRHSELSGVILHKASFAWRNAQRAQYRTEIRQISIPSKKWKISLYRIHKIYIEVNIYTRNICIL